MINLGYMHERVRMSVGRVVNGAVWASINMNPMPAANTNIYVKMYDNRVNNLRLAVLQEVKKGVYDRLVLQ